MNSIVFVACVLVPHCLQARISTSHLQKVQLPCANQQVIVFEPKTFCDELLHLLVIVSLIADPATTVIHHPRHALVS